MLIQLTLGCAMILATVIVHGVFTATGVGFLREHHLNRERREANLHASLVMALFVLWMFIATVVEVWLWAGLYRILGVFETVEESLYFSTVTMTTLGYGDVVLDSSWRLLSAFEAANGLFLFGWSTALVFAVVQWLYGKR